MYTFSHLFCVNWARKSHSIIFGSLGVRFNQSWYSKITNFTYDGSFHAWNSPCEKRRWLSKLLTRRSIKNNIYWKLSWKVCQIQLNWGPTLLGKYLCIFVLSVHNSINHSRGFMAFTPHRYPNQVSPNLAWVEDGWNKIQQLLCSESDRAQTPDLSTTCWIQGIFYAISNGMIGITLPPQSSVEWNPKSWELLQRKGDLGILGCESQEVQHLLGETEPLAWWDNGGTGVALGGTWPQLLVSPGKHQWMKC